MSRFNYGCKSKIPIFYKQEPYSYFLGTLQRMWDDERVKQEKETDAVSVSSMIQSI